jgi:hypothetical protein
LGKTLLPDDVRSAYPVEGLHLHGWWKTLVEVLHELKLRTSDLAKTWGKQISEFAHTEERQHTSFRQVHKGTDAIDYSRMNYEELRTIADDDSIADKMSNEEYESLSVELWRKFSVEKLTT